MTTFFDHYRDVGGRAITPGSLAAPDRHGRVRAVDVAVGPGVFIPRPETESMLEWATAQRLPDTPVDPRPVHRFGRAGAGSGAALARGPRDRRRRLRRGPGLRAPNCAGTRVELLRADVTAPGVLTQLDGQVDLLVSNPPYVPDGAELEPEVLDHDPSHAVFGGPDGMAVITAIVGLAGRLLRPGGLFAVEHDDTTSAQTVELISSTALFDDIVATRLISPAGPDLSRPAG